MTVMEKDEGALVEDSEIDVDGVNVVLNLRKVLERILREVKPQKVLYVCNNDVLEVKGEPALTVLVVIRTAGKGQVSASC